jgi:DNA (cytosine-5)-methyltransferase 1
MEHREIKTPEQIEELKLRSPGGYRNLREVVINEMPDSLLPTPAVGHIRNHDEPIENYLQRRQDFVDGRTKGMPGASLGVAVRMEMMPTPIASEGIKASAAQSSEERLKTGQVFLTNIIHDVAVENGLPVPPRLLPTPISSDSKGTGPADANRVTVQLRAINHLLPTVTTQESKSGPSQLNRNTPPLNAILPEMQRLQTNWGKFTDAIERWESLTRPAPSPTKPDGKDGSHRLSAEFTEWMMGLPEGWVTADDLGLKRNDQLKACGNGVVPQQAELALSILLDEETLKQIRK